MCTFIYNVSDMHTHNKTHKNIHTCVHILIHTHMHRDIQNWDVYCHHASLVENKNDCFCQRRTSGFHALEYKYLEVYIFVKIFWTGYY